MHPSHLFPTPIEQQFDQWLSKFTNLEELFASRRQLYSKLTRQLVEGGIDEHVTIEGLVYVSPGAHVKAGAVLKGPLVIGPHSVIDYGAKVLGDVFIGSGCYVNAGAVISSSILTKDCLVGENCVIHNSILGCGVFAKPGCLIGDATTASGEVGTFLGDASKLGLGCIVCPGSRVLQHQHVASGAVISGVLDDQ